MAKRKIQKISAVLFGLVLLYAIIGFFVVPRVARDRMIKAIQVQYGVTATVDKIYLNPFDFEVEVTNLRIPADPLGASTENRLELGRLNLNLELFPLLQKRVVLKSFNLSNSQFNFTVYKNGHTNWTSVAEGEAVSGPTAAKENESKPWVITLEQVELENIKLGLSDLTHVDPLNLPVGPINLIATNISTSLGSETSLEKLNILFGNSGRLQVGGKLSLEPLTADVQFEVSRLPMEFMTSYLSDKSRLAVKSGELNINGRATYINGQAKLAADANVDSLELIQQKSLKSALAWKTLEMKNILMQTAPMQVRINEMTLTALSTGLVLKKDGLLNYKDYLRDEKPRAIQASAGPSVGSSNSANRSSSKKAVDFEVAHFNINESQLNYSDQQIKPNFDAHIDHLNGAIEPLTLDPNKKINVNLSGRVEAQGKFQAKGFVVPNTLQPKLDLDVDFNNIELTTFTPYAGKFAGYEISKGKMFLKLKYSLQNRFIRGQNNVILDQFTLGKQVESDEATNLPLKLALALMKDRDGKIIMSLPVEGDVNSPQFSMSGIVWTALKNALINIVAAPFDFLKSAMGGGDNLDMIFFEPGKSVLSEVEQAKLQQISKALSDRPQLVVEVQGSTQLADIEAIKKIKNTSHVTEDELKFLAEQRAQLVQNSFAGLKVEPERVYLISVSRIENDDKPPHTVLRLKSRD